MDPITVILDACVLYPPPLRDVFLELAVTGIYRPRWTNQIHDEWIENLLLNRKDLTRKKLDRTRSLMNSAVPDCLVTGYEPIIGSLNLPDIDDRHVLAAAITSKASLIVTFNISDFPSPTLKAYSLQAQHPDSFLVHLFDAAPEIVCTAIKKLRSRLQHPPLDVTAYLAVLERQRIPNFVNRLHVRKDIL